MKIVKWIGKSILILIAILMIISIGLVAFSSLPWILIGVGILLEPNPPAPAVDYAEFPFSITYEIDGEIETVNDIYVCEYEGIGANEGEGKYNKWNTYLKNKETKLISYNSNYYVLSLATVDNEEIRFYLGTCEYYMGLAEEGYFYGMDRISPGDIIIAFSPETRALTEEELYNDYGIRIIEKSISPPLS